MELVVYVFRRQNNEIESPLLKYLQKYVISEKDNVQKIEKKHKRLANIEMHLKYLRNNKGKFNIPPLVQKYTGFNIGILKIKEGKILIRISFFVYQDKIIILDVIEKPKLYEKAKKKLVDKIIYKFLNKSEKYKQDCLKNNNFTPLSL